jgi:hypothetical protein
LQLMGATATAEQDEAAAGGNGSDTSSSSSSVESPTYDWDHVTRVSVVVSRRGRCPSVL